MAQHNRLMKASGYSVMGLLGLGAYRAAEREAIDLAKFWLDRTASPTRRTGRPALAVW